MGAGMGTKLEKLVALKSESDCVESGQAWPVCPALMEWQYVITGGPICKCHV